MTNGHFDHDAFFVEQDVHWSFPVYLKERCYFIERKMSSSSSFKDVECDVCGMLSNGHGLYSFVDENTFPSLNPDLWVIRCCYRCFVLLDVSSSHSTRAKIVETQHFIIRIIYLLSSNDDLTPSFKKDICSSVFNPKITFSHVLAQKDKEEKEEIEKMKKHLIENEVEPIGETYCLDDLFKDNSPNSNMFYESIVRMSTEENKPSPPPAPSTASTVDLYEFLDSSLPDDDFFRDTSSSRFFDFCDEE